MLAPSSCLPFLNQPLPDMISTTMHSSNAICHASTAPSHSPLCWQRARQVVVIQAYKVELLQRPPLIW
jgi:hypothetical protein